MIRNVFKVNMLPHPYQKAMQIPIHKAVLIQFTRYSKQHFSRQITKPKLLLDSELLITSEIKMRNFQSLQQIDQFISSNDELNLTEWTYVLKQMVRLNHKEILEIDHQQSIIQRIPLDTAESVEFISQLCSLLVQYKKHKFQDEGLINLKELIKSQLINENFNLFNHVSLFQVLELFQPINEQQFAEQWIVLIEQILEQNDELKLNKQEIQAIYKFLQNSQEMDIKISIKDKLLIVVEQNVQRYISTFQKTDLLLLVQFNTFKKRIFNVEIVSQFTKRIVQFADQFTIGEIAQINRFLNFLKIQDPQWFNVQSKVLQTMLEKHESKTLFIELNDLIESLQNTYCFESLRPILIPYFKTLEGHLISQITKMTTQQQLNFLRLHSLLIEAIYHEKTSSKDFRTSIGDKRLEKLNNNYYEMVIPYLNDMNYKETLVFLENASVVGISKRKVCALVLDRGLEGLSQFNQQLHDDKDHYALLGYYKLLNLFITSQDQLVLIEQKFQQVAIDTLQLQSNYGHLAIRRDKLIDL